MVGLRGRWERVALFRRSTWSRRAYKYSHITSLYLLSRDFQRVYTAKDVPNELGCYFSYLFNIL